MKWVVEPRNDVEHVGPSFVSRMVTWNAIYSFRLQRREELFHSRIVTAISLAPQAALDHVESK